MFIQQKPVTKFDTHIYAGSVFIEVLKYTRALSGIHHRLIKLVNDFKSKYGKYEERKIINSSHGNRL